MNEIETYVSELRKLLRCPIDWAAVIRASTANDNEDSVEYADFVIRFLECYWCHFLESFSIEGEWEYAKCFNCHLGYGVDDPFEEIDWDNRLEYQNPLNWEAEGTNDVVRLGGEMVYIREWIPSAIVQYRQRTAPLASMRMSDPRNKHIRRGDTDEQVCQRAGGKQSFFFPRYYDALPRLFWYLMESEWHKVISNKHVYRAIDCGVAIGASDHTETSFVRFDIQSPNAHAYPILRSDAPLDFEILDDPVSVFGNHDFKYL